MVLGGFRSFHVLVTTHKKALKTDCAVWDKINLYQVDNVHVIIVSLTRYPLYSDSFRK